MNDLIHQATDLLTRAQSLFNQYIWSNAGFFIKALLNVLIAVLSFIIDVLRWIAFRL